ncbi:MAG: Rrf2 family transcriptional regulator [Planctomycetes bacterium]|nr:Rrf2 family transcriptional regulator [Planctomycetota bacterium]
MPTRGEYALRAMAYLATLGDESAPALQVADQTGVPAAYLSKLLRRLTVAGLLVAQKGHGGGFALAYEPADISFDEILNAVDVDVDEDHCAFGWKSCDPKHPCPLHPARSSLMESLLHWARGTTLADVLNDWVPISE